MRRIPVSTWLLPSLLGLSLPVTAFGLQAPTNEGPLFPPNFSPSQVPQGPPPAYYPPGQGPQPAPAATAAPPASNPSYATWTDPAEGAFTVSLPTGWPVSGGTARNSLIDVHYVVRAQSPDSGVQFFMDDPSILIREVPNAGTQMMGVRPGQVVPSGSGTNLEIEQYRPGAQFASDYVKQTFCPAATSIQGGAIADQTQALNVQWAPIAQAEGKQIRLDVGEVSFHCGANVGYVYAITALGSQPGGAVSIWAVYRIAGYISTVADSGMAAAAVNQALGTFQMNQAWLQSYAQQNNDIAGNVIRESDAITQSTIQREQQMNTQMLQSIQAARQNAAANQKAIAGSTTSPSGGSGNGHDYNAQLDTKNVCDNLGRCQTVDADVTYWWSDCSGEFHPGSDTGQPPPAGESACWSQGH